MWVAQDTREQVIDFVNYWLESSGIFVLRARLEGTIYGSTGINVE